MVTLHNKQFEIFITNDAIAERVKSLAITFNESYAGLNPVFLVVLNGAFLFAAELTKNLNIDCEIDFIKMASYEGTQTTGTVKKLSDPKSDLHNRHVIIIEDIVDTGNTYLALHEQVMSRLPASLKIATLLFKPEVYKQTLPIHYTCFEVQNWFYVGYGLDYDELGRNLQHIYKLV